MTTRRRTNTLPPLTWLRAFEAAGRSSSFRAAADELHVTPSTISHHVRDLEARLAVPLFDRSGGGVRLTAEGEAYLARVSAGFEALAEAADALVAGHAAHTLRIGAFPFLASEVLIPNLEELRARLPGVTLSVVSDTSVAALTRADPADRLDAIVRYGDGRFPGYRARKLTDVALVPIASPGLLTTLDSGSAAMAAAPRITVAGPYDGWAVWSEGSGITLPDADLLVFDSYLAAMRATEQGLGIGLGILPFIRSWLDERRVVPVLEQPVPAGQSSYLVTAHHAGDRREVMVLEEWLLARFA